MKKIFQNWKTTTAGIVMVVGAVVAYLADPTQLMASLAAALTGIGLIFAADATDTTTAE